MTIRKKSKAVRLYKKCTKAYEQANDFLDYCEGTCRRRPDYIRSMYYTIYQFINELRCEDLLKVTNLDFSHWAQGQTKRGIKSSTACTRMAILIKMYRYFKDMDFEIAIKIPLLIKPKYEPEERPFYLREEIAEVLRVTDDPMDWLIIRLTFDVGLRIGELASLHLSNFDGNRLSYSGKGGRRHTVFVCEETYEKLQEWIGLAGVTDYLWINEFKKPIKKDALRIRMEKLFRDNGHEKMTPHSLRHSMCTDVLLHHADIREAQKLMHHADVQTTMRYAHELKDKERELHARYRNFRLAEM